MTLESLLAQDGVDLHGSGANRTARCPFHKDAKPSLSVNIEEGVYQCHGCGAKGNAVTYLMETQGLSKPAAQARLRNGPATRPKRLKKPPTVYKALPKDRIAEHPYVNADGEILYVVVRNAVGQRSKCTQWSPVEGGWIAQGLPTDQKRPLYRLPELLSSDPKKQVWVVEGEKCADTVKRHYPKGVVTTWSGGSSAPFSKVDFSPLHGRDVILIADADVPGRNAMTSLGKHLAPHCAKLRIVLPEGSDGNDIHDWLETGGRDEAAATIRRHIKDVPKAKKPKKKVEPSPPPKTEGIESNHYFKVIGNIEDHVAIMLNTYRILRYSRSAMTQVTTLLALADYEWWLTFTGRDTLNTSVCQQVGSVLIRAADRLGQIDPSQFLGRGCFKHNGHAAWHLGDRILMEGKTEKLDAIQGKVLKPGVRIEVSDTAATTEERAALTDAVLRYRWKTKEDGRRFLGWIVAAAVGGALEWRPHAWLSAPATSGKSWLLEHVLSPVLGPFVLQSGDPTSASVARKLGSDAFGVVFDEAEVSRTEVPAVLDLARLASGGGNARWRSESGTSHGVTVIQPRFSIFMSSVTVSMLTHANRSRFVQVRLSGQGVADWRSVESSLRAALVNPTRFVSAIIRDATEIVNRVREFNRIGISDGVPSRQAAIEAALSAGWEWWSGQIDTVTTGTDETGDVAGSDAADLLRYLMSLRLRIGTDEMSIATVLKERHFDKVALNNGFKLTEELDLWLAPHHPSLSELVNRGKAWAGVDVQSTLMQIDGVTRSDNPLGFGYVKQRALHIPARILDELGIDLSRPQVEIIPNE